NPDALTSSPELFMVASTHHFHGDECLCGFKSARSRDRTEHIMLHTLTVAQPVVNREVEAFSNQRPEYITALTNTRGTDDQADYHRWQGGAEARRQLAPALGWTVPHSPGDTTRPEVNDA